MLHENSSTIFYPVTLRTDDGYQLNAKDGPMSLILNSQLCFVQLPTSKQPAQFIDIKTKRIQTVEIQNKRLRTRSESRSVNMEEMKLSLDCNFSCLHNGRKRNFKEIYVSFRDCSDAEEARSSILELNMTSRGRKASGSQTLDISEVQSLHMKETQSPVKPLLMAHQPRAMTSLLNPAEKSNDQTISSKQVSSNKTGRGQYSSEGKSRPKGDFLSEVIPRALKAQHPLKQNIPRASAANRKIRDNRVKFTPEMLSPPHLASSSLAERRKKRNGRISAQLREITAESRYSPKLLSRKGVYSLKSANTSSKDLGHDLSAIVKEGMMAKGKSSASRGFKPLLSQKPSILGGLSGNPRKSELLDPTWDLPVDDIEDEGPQDTTNKSTSLQKPKAHCKSSKSKIKQKKTITVVNGSNSIVNSSRKSPPVIIATHYIGDNDDAPREIIAALSGRQGPTSTVSRLNFPMQKPRLGSGELVNTGVGKESKEVCVEAQLQRASDTVLEQTLPLPARKPKRGSDQQTAVEISSDSSESGISTYTNPPENRQKDEYQTNRYQEIPQIEDLQEVNGTQASLVVDEKLAKKSLIISFSHRGPQNQGGIVVRKKCSVLQNDQAESLKEHCKPNLTDPEHLKVQPILNTEEKKPPALPQTPQLTGSENNLEYEDTIQSDFDHLTSGGVDSRLDGQPDNISQRTVRDHKPQQKIQTNDYFEVFQSKREVRESSQPLQGSRLRVQGWTATASPMRAVAINNSPSPKKNAPRRGIKRVRPVTIKMQRRCSVVVDFNGSPKIHNPAMWDEGSDDDPYLPLPEASHSEKDLLQDSLKAEGSLSHNTHLNSTGGIYDVEEKRMLTNSKPAPAPPQAQSRAITEITSTAVIERRAMNHRQTVKRAPFSPCSPRSDKLTPFMRMLELSLEKCVEDANKVQENSRLDITEEGPRATFTNSSSTGSPADPKSQWAAFETQERRWEGSLLPHQRETCNALVHLSRQLVRCLVDSEYAVKGILEDYEAVATGLVERMIAVRESDIREYRSVANSGTARLRREYDQVLNQRCMTRTRNFVHETRSMVLGSTAALTRVEGCLKDYDL